LVAAIVRVSNHPRIGIVDYGSGNIRSVCNAVEAAGAAVELVRQGRDVERCTHVILPGVGAFGFCADRLRASGLLPALTRFALTELKPLLGICVGMQLMADFSEELGRHEGLGWVGGSVRALEKSADRSVRVPHVGWNDVTFKDSFGLFRVGDVVDFYFDHSFAFFDVEPKRQLATCRHGQLFSAVVQKGNIVAVQFHPEKSQAAGMRLLKSFLAMQTLA
jgi:imidazole glycerol-phosphate synthase subunit HisH